MQESADHVGVVALDSVVKDGTPPGLVARWVLCRYGNNNVGDQKIINTNLVVIKDIDNVIDAHVSTSSVNESAKNIHTAAQHGLEDRRAQFLLCSHGYTMSMMCNIERKTVLRETSACERNCHAVVA